MKPGVGVYCRPSCAARAARLENIPFHASCAGPFSKIGCYPAGL
ncbi:Ada metal-binding domain-containing protein [Acidisarcina polymorpha]